MIEAAGYVPTVVEYRVVGWTHAQLQRLFAAMDATPRDVMREKGTPAAETAGRRIRDQSSKR
jgi:arsenate reductase